MEVFSDLEKLKERVQKGEIHACIVDRSLVLGCGPDYFVRFLKRIKDKNPENALTLWLDCQDQPGDILKAFAAGATHIMTSLSGDVFTRLSSIAEQQGIALRQIPTKLKEARLSLA